MKKLSFVLVVAILLAVGAVGTMSAPSYAQGYGGYNYPPPPQNPYATPWVGSNTPWVHYNGDWFLNGILYYFFGNNYGWAPYYSYPPNYIERPNDWYGSMWNTWYQQNPNYWQSFTQRYPYWRTHQHSQRYNRDFYDQHHRGQGGGWNQGFHGVRPPAAPGPVHPPGATAPAVRTPKATGPAQHAPAATGPAVRTPEPTGPAVHTPKATGPAQHAPEATGSGGKKPVKTPPAEEKKER